ncbi:MAG: hypothetical protein ACFNLM_02210 [Selenomonas noxia]
MKTCYYVKTRVDDHGHASVIETGAVDVKELPEGRCSSTDYEDIYTDWFATREEAEDFVREVRDSHDAKGRMAEILRSSKVSQRRLDLLVQMRLDLAKKDAHRMWIHDDQLRKKYAELFGKMDDVVVAEAQYLIGLYDGVTDIAAAEAKCLTEIFREPN